MLIDSHCHLDRVNLSPYDGEFSKLMTAIHEAGVTRLLCVAIDLDSYDDMLALVADYPEISVSVGVHPNEQDCREPTIDELVCLAQHPKNVAIGETGLDYFRTEGDLHWQRQRFRNHIQAARAAGKPLIVHTREAREDTLTILREERADEVGGVLHCFTETWEMAEAALELGFYISFSGIVTFKNAEQLRSVATQVPDERILIETDSPYLAPVPYRGRSNEPRYLGKVAETIATLRGISVAQLADQSSANYFRLFSAAQS